MSKQSRKKARKRKKHAIAWAVICGKCGELEDPSPGAVLTRVADALNAGADYGVTMKARHGVLMAVEGYVLVRPDGQWVARTLAYDAFVQVSVLPDDMDD